MGRLQRVPTRCAPEAATRANVIVRRPTSRALTTEVDRRVARAREDGEARVRAARDEANQLRAEAEVRGAEAAHARGEARLASARDEALRIHAEADIESGRLMAQAAARLPEIVAEMLRTLLPELP